MSEKSASSGGPQLWRIVVSTPPGATPLTRTPRAMYSTASALVSIFTPPLDAQYAAEYGCPIMPAVETVLTMAPPCSSMPGSTARHMRNVPVRLTARTLSQPDRDWSVVWQKPPTPAMLHRLEM